MNDIPNSVDKLKKFITNFVERPALVPGGCPPLNSSIDSDDGGPALPKKSGMGTERLARLPPVDREKWIKKGEVARMSAQTHLATLMIASRESALMISRLTRDRQALGSIQHHLSDFHERTVRVRVRKIS